MPTLVLGQMLELLAQDAPSPATSDIRDWWRQIEIWRARRCLKYDAENAKVLSEAVIA